jgi:outer membrane protein OmpA-like peptidoglycan-associated protein
MQFMIRLSLVLLLVMTAGCATQKTLVALAPDPDGKVGSLTVTNDAGSVALDAAYQASVTAGRQKKPGPALQFEKESIDSMFAEALAIQPRRPVHFLLYFEKGTQLNGESLRLVPEILAAIAERASQDVSVVGHTDTTGSNEFNTELSQKRAQSVKELLVQEGVPEQAIRTTSHGKENPLVVTGDNVYEPRNRRVEVDVR